jgi:hypothetical protein
VPEIQLDLPGRRKLLADWFAQIARESGINFSQHGTGGQAFTIGAPNDFHVTAHFVDAPPFLKFVASDPARQRDVDRIVPMAVTKVEHGDFGSGVWYSTGLPEIQFTLASSPSWMGSLVQRLGNQTSIVGWRRLGPSILLEFKEILEEGEDEGKQRLLAPPAVVDVHIAAPGPAAGHFSSHVAHSVIETVAAICTFALGRPVSLPPTLFPSKDDAIAKLTERRSDHGILTLARKHIGLDIFSSIAVPGGLDVSRRARSALITYDAAVQQQRDSVACILYVAAAECLTTPNTEWRHSKLTKRFVEFFNELMPDQLDTIVAHGNFEDAFELRRGNRTARSLRRALLDRIYDYRSGQLHEGLTPSYQGFAMGSDMRNEVRRGLFADFSEGAILRYLAAPRSSLVGHPGFELIDSANRASGRA